MGAADKLYDFPCNKYYINNEMTLKYRSLLAAACAGMILIQSLFL